MDEGRENELDQAAFRRLEKAIAEKYPFGHYVAIAEGQIVADAAEWEQLNAALKRLGHDRSEVLVVQAGLDYSDAIILFVGRDSKSNKGAIYGREKEPKYKSFGLSQAAGAH